jgi:hypothetical protein
MTLSLELSLVAMGINRTVASKHTTQRCLQLGREERELSDDKTEIAQLMAP